MHRHGYQGRKFGRERDQRKALMKSLADSLILNESIETTHSKAKEVRPYVEKLITKAKLNSLASRRHVLKNLHTVEATNKLVDQIAPLLSDRSSGYLRIKRTTIRRGDNVQLASVSFVDDLSAKKVKKAEPKKAVAKKAPVKKSTTSKRTKTEAKK